MLSKKITEPNVLFGIIVCHYNNIKLWGWGLTHSIVREMLVAGIRTES